MSIIKDTFFGGAEKKAAKAQTKALEQGQEYTRQASEQARGDIFKLFPAAQQNLAGGFQGALNVFGQSLPAQTQAFQQGNVGAQQQLISGLPQIQNALFGNAVDYSQFQPTQVQQPDLSFFQQQLPQYVDPYASQEQSPQQNANPFGGYGGGGFGQRGMGFSGFGGGAGFGGKFNDRFKNLV